MLWLFALVMTLGPSPAMAAEDPQWPLSRAIEAYFPLDIPMQALDLEAGTLQAFYAARDFRPAWLDEDSGTERQGVTELLDALRDSRLHGLDQARYRFDRLLHLRTSVRGSERALFDLMLSDALIRYARDLHQGQTRPEAVDPNWHIPGDTLDVLQVLEAAAAHQDVAGTLASLGPQHPGYQRLTEALERYHRIAAYGGWPTIEPGPTLRPGDAGPRVESLRWRLWLEGHLMETGTDPAVFDADLEAAVRRFQRLHTLEEDGLVGRDTLEALNVPVAERIAQIRLNLERWRWLPHHLDERYLMVNMAGFELRAYRDSVPELVMRVIIGKPYRSTPSFSGPLTHVVINPYWNVPRRIAREDLIPAQIRDGGYLASRDIRVLEGWAPDSAELDPARLDWAAFAEQGFPYRLRQDPGPGNSLGRIKFMLSNPFSIYLHDTPDRHLFERTVRSFSSGCIRVEDPEGLAMFLFSGSGDKGWDRARTQALLDSDETRTRYLPAAVPVYLVYLTAWVDDAGQLHFADDIYSRDRPLAVQLAGGGRDNTL